jgi:hypothetical protein
MAIERDNDEERASIVDRLLDEHLRSRPRPKPNAGRSVKIERRRHRSDVELRMARAELEGEWNKLHGKLDRD